MNNKTLIPCGISPPLRAISSFLLKIAIGGLYGRNSIVAQSPYFNMESYAYIHKENGFTPNKDEREKITILLKNKYNVLTQEELEYKIKEYCNRKILIYPMETSYEKPLNKKNISLLSASIYTMQIWIVLVSKILQSPISTISMNTIINETYLKNQRRKTFIQKKEIVYKSIILFSRLYAHIRWNIQTCLVCWDSIKPLILYEQLPPEEYIINISTWYNNFSGNKNLQYILFPKHFMLLCNQKKHFHTWNLIFFLFLCTRKRTFKLYELFEILYGNSFEKAKSISEYRIRILKYFHRSLLFVQKHSGLKFDFSSTQAKTWFSTGRVSKTLWKGLNDTTITFKLKKTYNDACEDLL